MPSTSKVQYRYVTCFVLFSNLVMFYMARASLSVGLLNMVKPSSSLGNTNSSTSCAVANSNPSKIVGSFEWDDKSQGLILGFFFFGYLSTNFLGSIITELVGIRVIHAISIAGTTIFTFLMVPSAYLGLKTFVGCRFLIGFFSGPLYPVIQVMMGHWAPSNERTIMTVATHSGNIIGLLLTFGLGGFIVGVNENGWKYLYYFCGSIGVVNFILWVIFGYDYPQQHPFISSEEVTHVSNSVRSKYVKNKLKAFKLIPFRAIFTSPQVYIQVMAHTSKTFIVYAFMTGHPKYLRNVFGLKTQHASYVSMIAFIFNFISQVSYSFFTDYIRRKDIIRISLLRRINSGIAVFGAVMFLTPVGFIPCGYMPASVALLGIGFSLLSINQSGYLTAMVDLSPKYAGIIMGFANTVASLFGFLQPQLVGRLIDKFGYILGWRYAFMATAGVSLTLGLPFIIFGSSETQKWADGKKPKEPESKISSIS